MLVPFTSQAVRVTVRGLEQDVILASKVVVASVSIMCRLSPGLPTGRRSHWCRSFLRDRPRHCRFITERRHNHRHGNHQCEYSNAASPAKVMRCICSDYVVIRLGASTTRPRGRARRLSQRWSHLGRSTRYSNFPQGIRKPTSPASCRAVRRYNRACNNRLDHADVQRASDGLTTTAGGRASSP
jgi:hypothetical protein